jgi:D-tyrosyl-tRNA(Tyr) deacylase
MRAVVQRVVSGRVVVEDQVVGAIGPGLAVLLGAEAGDDETDLTYTLDKILNLRVFDDPSGRLNLSLLDVGAELLIVSQFTLLGDCRKGRRPSFVRAMRPEQAEPMLDDFVGRARARGVTVATGVFGANMRVSLEGDGPVTLLIDSKKGF